MTSGKSAKIKWDKAEIDRLKFLYKFQVPVRDISKILNRTNLSIWATAQRFNITEKRSISYDRDVKKIKKFYNFYNTNLKKNSKDFGEYTRKISHLSEQLTMIKLLMLGFDVYKPVLDSSKIDLLGYKKNKMFKFQVKTAGYSDHFDYFETQLSNRLRKRDTKEMRLRYSENQVDFFIIKLTGIFKFYIIPIKDALSQKSPNTRFFPNRKKAQIKSKADVFNTDKYFEAFDLIK